MIAPNIQIYNSIYIDIIMNGLGVNEFEMKFHLWTPYELHVKGKLKCMTILCKKYHVNPQKTYLKHTGIQFYK